MGNYILSPFKKNNDENKHNETFGNRIIEKKINNLNGGVRISSNLNDLTNFADNSNNLKRNKKLNKKESSDSNKNIYYHGYKNGKNKKYKKSKLLFEDKKEGIIMNNIRRLSLILFNKKEEEKVNNVEINYNKEQKYNSNDNYYHQYENKNKKEKIKEKSSDKNQQLNTKKENSKKKNKNDGSKSKKNKAEKTEKSSQFMLLNNYNAFNTLKEINKEKIVKMPFDNNINQNDLVNEIKIEDEEEIRNETIISKNSYIKDNENKENEKTLIINDNIFTEDIQNYKHEEENNEDEKNINFKETNAFSVDINLESKLIDNSIYSYNGESSIDKKEGIGKVVYKNKIGLMSIFENNKIKGPIIISDIIGNSFQGYLDENNNLNGYFNLKFNFNKDILKKKYKYNNTIIINKEESKEQDEIILILSNYMNIVNKYLNMSTNKYNYYNIESEIYKNNINNYGIIKWRNNSKYIGEIKNNMKHGIGLFIWSDNSRYEGEFFEDKMEGWGLIHFFDGKIFQGQILNGVPHGYGEFIWTNNNRYVGNYKNGQKEGFGIYVMNIINKKKEKNEITTYFGFWKNGKQDGYGIIIKNKKINYVKYKEGKKIRQYDYEIFIGKISKVVNKKHEKIFFSDVKTLKNIIKYIMNF